MANATQLPNLFFGQWARPDAGKPILSAPVTADITDLDFVFSEPLLDEDGAVISKAVVIGITQRAGYTEAVYFAAGAFTAGGGDGTSATATARGVDLSGLDYTTSNAGLAVAHDVGEKVFVQVSGVYEGILNAALRGASVSTGGVTFTLGAGADSTVTLQRNNGGSFLGFLRWNTTTDQVQYSNDGAVWISIDDSIASVLVKVSAADTTAGYLYDKITVGGSLTKSIVNPAGDEELLLEVDAVSVDTTYDFSEAVLKGNPVSASGEDEVENTVYRTLSTGGTEKTFDAGAASNIIAVNLDSNLWVNVYAETSQLYATAGTADEVNVQTYGTPVGAGANTGNSMAACKLSDTTFAVSYRASGSSEVYARIGSVNPTTLAVTFGTAVLVGTQNASAQGYTAIAPSDSATLVCVYRDTANSNIGTAKAATFTGTTLSAFGTGEAMQAMSDIALAQIDEDALAVFYRAADTFGYSELLTVSGTTVSSGSPVQIDSSASTAFQASTISLGASGHILVTWVGGVSGYIQARICERDGITVDFPTAATAVNALVALTPCGAVCNSTTAYIVYEESASSDGKFNEVAISGTTLTVGTQYSFNSTDNVSSTSACAVTSKNRFLIAYRDEADTNNGNAIIFQNKDNRDQCAGLALADTAEGAEGTVRSKGIVEVTPTLTSGAAYYLGTSAVYSTSPSTTALKLGVAKNPDEIDVDIATEMPALENKEGYDFFSVSTMTGAQANVLVGGTGSDADALHAHPGIKGLGFNPPGTTFTFNLDLALVNDVGASTGNINITAMGAYPTNTTTVDKYEFIIPPSISGLNNLYSNAVISVEWFGYLVANVGFRNNVGDVGGGTGAYYAGFDIAGGNLRAISADNTTPTTTVISADPAAPRRYRVEYNPSPGSILFYVNDTLVATHPGLTGATVMTFGFDLNSNTTDGFISYPTFTYTL